MFFEYKSDVAKTRHIGLLAQEVEVEYPEIISTGPEGMLGLSYQDVVPILLQGIRELTTRVEALELTAMQKQSRRSAR